MNQSKVLSHKTLNRDELHLVVRTQSINCHHNHSFHLYRGLLLVFHDAFCFSIVPRSVHIHRVIPTDLRSNDLDGTSYFDEYRTEVPIRVSV